MTVWHTLLRGSALVEGITRERLDQRMHPILVVPLSTGEQLILIELQSYFAFNKPAPGDLAFAGGEPPPNRLRVCAAGDAVGDQAREGSGRVSCEGDGS
jgi:hypothetical protein